MPDRREDAAARGQGDAAPLVGVVRLAARAPALWRGGHWDRAAAVAERVVLRFLRGAGRAELRRARRLGGVIATGLGRVDRLDAPLQRAELAHRVVDSLQVGRGARLSRRDCSGEQLGGGTDLFGRDALEAKRALAHALELAAQRSHRAAQIVALAQQLGPALGVERVLNVFAEGLGREAVLVDRDDAARLLLDDEAALAEDVPHIGAERHGEPRRVAVPVHAARLGGGHRFET